MSVMGTRVRRVEDPRFLTTGGTYLADVRDPALAGAAHVTFVRSPAAHALLRGVDVAAAAAAPGVLGVFTGADLALAPADPEVAAPAPFARPHLAVERVRFVGEPVAAVVADSPATGADAAELVELDLEPLPVVVDPLAAVRDEVLLFPGTATNVVAEEAFGDADAADFFDGCEVVVERDLVNSRVAPAPLEVRGTAAAPDGPDRLTVWVSTQNPFIARSTFAKALGLPKQQVRVIAPDVGGGFGAKIGCSVEDVVVAALAHRLGRPLLWTETRTENMQAMGHGRAQRQRVRIGGRRDGTILAYSLAVVADAGAYPGVGAMLPEMTRMMTSGVYRIPRAAFRSRSVVTNTCPTVAYRGAGRPEAAAAIERAVDLFAAEIGADPAQVRFANFVPPDAFPFTTPSGQVYDSGDYPAALRAVLDAAGYEDLRAEQRRRRDTGDGRLLGIGLATYVEVTGDGAGGGEVARVEVHGNGRVVVFTGVSPHGQGHATSFAMIVADRLGVPMEAVTLRHGDTAELDQGTGTMGSRSLQVGGSAVAQVADRTLEEARELAGELFEAATADVVLDRARGLFHVAGSPDQTRTWGQVASLAASRGGGPGLVVSGRFDTSDATFPFGAHLAVVEVDRETGRVALVRLVSVDDAGYIVNPVTAEGQRHGGLAQGAAQALLEQVVYDPDGNPLTANFADYGIVTAPDLPSFELLEMATPTPRNPLGAKGIGESGTIGSTPAVQNAVVDALAHLGVRHIDLPASPEAVWRAMEDARCG